MPREYLIKTTARSIVVTVTEYADRIEVKMTADRYGAFGDEDDMLRQMSPITAGFDADPRPVVFVAPNMGVSAMIDTAADGQSFAFVEGATRQ